MATATTEVTADWRKSEAANGHLKRFEYILQSGFRSDVLFIVGIEKTEVKAHKVILSTGSKVFDDLFQEDKDKTTFEVPDLKPEEFTLLLKFLYTGECPINVEECLPVIHAASKYEVSDLVRHCGKLIGETLTPGSAIKVFQHAIKHEDLELEEEALNCICMNGFKIVESAHFTELSVGELSKILERDDLEVKNETQLFEAVMNWGKAELKRQKMIETHKYLRSVLEQVIYLVRFPQMDQSDFSLKVYSSKILLDSDYTALLMYFLVPEENRAAAQSGPFSSKPRAAYSPRGKEFILKRLVKSSGIVMDLVTNTSTGKPYFSPTFQEHSIRLKTDAPIWVKSIGINSLFLSTPNIRAVYDSNDMFHDHLRIITSYNCQKCRQPTNSTDKCMKCDVQNSEVIAVMIQLKNVTSKVLASKTETIRPLQCLHKCVHHVQFINPVYLRADEWYTANFAVYSGDLYGNQYQPADGVGSQMTFELKDGDGIERKIKFEFKNDYNPRYTGTTQGFIPEIGFMIE